MYTAKSIRFKTGLQSKICGRFSRYEPDKEKNGHFPWTYLRPVINNVQNNTPCGERGRSLSPDSKPSFLHCSCNNWLYINLQNIDSP